MKTSFNTFNAKLFINGEERLSLKFDFGGDYVPENRSEIVGTIRAKFMRYMDLNKRYKLGILNSRDRVDFQFLFGGKIYSTADMGFETNVHFRFNKTIEQKIEQFIADAFDFGQIDLIEDAKYI